MYKQIFHEQEYDLSKKIAAKKAKLDYDEGTTPQSVAINTSSSDKNTQVFSFKGCSVVFNNKM